MHIKLYEPKKTLERVEARVYHKAAPTGELLVDEVVLNYYILYISLYIDIVCFIHKII